MSSQWAGVVLVDKREGQSSHSALGFLKKHYGTRKVGHAGTLDPFATGLLIALVGQATRCARFFSGLDKTYLADFTFGAETDTDDRTGHAVRRAGIPDLARVLDHLQHFTGEISQVPPSYSAIHVDGNRAYELARSGEVPKLPSRNVRVYSFSGSVSGPDRIRVTISCSAGTYVRSLARDLGRLVGSAAHVSELRRIGVGPFELTEVTDPEGTPVPIAEALLRLDGFTKWAVDETTAHILQNGGQPERGLVPDVSARLVAMSGCSPVAIVRLDDDRLAYELVIPRSDP